MNGVAFADLPGLIVVDLRYNVCIDKIFETEQAINKIRRRITKNCADSTRKKISCKTSTACNKIIHERFTRWFNRTPGCCEMNYGTNIDSPDCSFVTSGEYTNLETINIIHQRNIEFLPVLVHKSFRNLKFYWIADTPVQKISKKNFEKLSELVLLHLESNQIEVIKSDTFDDLIAMTEIVIRKFLLIIQTLLVLVIN